MRPLIYGNGRLLVCVDERGVVRDLYYPYAGMENHGGHVRLGLYDLGERRYGWLEEWGVEQGYEDASLIGKTVYTSPEFGAAVTVKEMVHHELDLFLRSFEVRNLSQGPKRFRLFSSQDYHILENNFANTAVRDGDMMSHYKRDRFILQSSSPPFDQFTTGISQWRGMEGTWRDAEDGALAGNPVAHGPADSTVGWTLPELRPGEASTVHFWACVGKNFPEAKRIDDWVRGRGVEAAYRSGSLYWASFLAKTPDALGRLPPSVQRAFRRSLLVVACHLDRGGSIIASCDSQIKQQGADYYTYCWPRDAAWVAVALDRAGYGHLSSQAFEFFKRAIDPRGFFRHKYTPAGDLGSTWHPLPMVQIDETATPLYAVYSHWRSTGNVLELSSLYEPFVKRAADYLTDSLDCGLPKPSFDLWEERKGIYTYSCASVFSGLRSAAAIATVLGDEESSERWGRAALAVKKAAVDRLYDPSLGRFLRGTGDATVDASAFAAWYWGLVDENDPMAAGTMGAIEKELTRPNGGVCRYAGDGYQGHMNSWPLCTLWLAQWHIRKKNPGRAMELMEWCVKNSSPTGLMPEQVGADGRPLSVLPLAWSHSAFILTVIEYLEALDGVR